MRSFAYKAVPKSILVISISIFCFSCANKPEKALPLKKIDEQLAWLESNHDQNADNALTLLSELHTKSKEQGYAYGQAKSSLLIGKVLLEIGGMGQCIDYLNEAKSLFSELEAQQGLAETYIQLAQLAEYSSNFPESREYVEQATAIYKEMDNQLGMANALSMMGHFFEKTAQYDSAIYYQQLALGLYESLEDTFGLAEVHDHIGSIYEDLDLYPSAKTHFGRAFQYNASIGNSKAAVVNLNNLGDTYRKIGNLDSAFFYTYQALEQAKELGNLLQERSALRDLSKIYYEKQMPDSAYYYMAEGYRMTADIFGGQAAEKIAKLETLFELSQKEERIALLEAKGKQDRYMLLLVVVSILAIMVVVALLFFQTVQKSRKRQKLLELRSELTKAEIENIKLNEQNLLQELQNKELQKRQLAEDLEQKNKTLAAQTLQMLEKNEFLHKTRKKLSMLLNTQDVKTKKEVKKIIRSIDLSFNQENDWAEFQHVFEEVHTGFLENLRKEHPDLTAAEIRLSILIKLNLPSRNIATILGISTDSLRIARYRLRKKLGINNEQVDLFSYITELKVA